MVVIAMFIKAGFSHVKMHTRRWKQYYFWDGLAFTWILIWWKHTPPWFLRDITGNGGKLCLSNNIRGRLGSGAGGGWGRSVSVYLLVYARRSEGRRPASALSLLGLAFTGSRRLHQHLFLPKPVGYLAWITIFAFTLYNHLPPVDSTHTVCNIYCICQVFKRPLGVLINVS